MFDSMWCCDCGFMHDSFCLLQLLSVRLSDVFFFCCFCVYFYCFFFFFQAEDGIRDLVRSRGLGDVYKRQVADGLGPVTVCTDLLKPGGYGRLSQYLDNLALRMGDSTSIEGFVQKIGATHWSDPVSYTHLTLPTSDLV